MAEFAGIGDCDEIFGTKPDGWSAKGNDSWGAAA